MVTVGAVNWFIDAYIDSVAVNLGSVHASNDTGLVVRALTRPAGPHTITVNLYSVGNANFTSGIANVAVDTIGV